MSDAFTLATFSGRVGETFTVQVDDNTSFDIELAEVSALGAARPGAREPFSLVFLGPVHAPQATYRMTNNDLGRFDIFIVPLGPEAGRMRYEAVFT
ncbi:MAG: DUF6916 family protein [Acidimicrobiales bacterium]